MAEWSRSDVLALAAAIIGLIAAIAVIDVIARRWLRRLLLFLLIIACSAATLAIVLHERMDHQLEIQHAAALQRPNIDHKAIEKLAREIATEAENHIALDKAGQLAAEQLRRTIGQNRQKLASAIVGKWIGSKWADDIEFLENGNFISTNRLHLIVITGTYRVLDEHHIEVIVQNPFLSWIRTADEWQIQIDHDTLTRGGTYSAVYRRNR